MKGKANDEKKETQFHKACLADLADSGNARWRYPPHGRKFVCGYNVHETASGRQGAL